MSVYRPTYTVTREQGRELKKPRKVTSRIWWFHFNFGGRHIQESSKSTRKTVAVEAEKQRRRELEESFNGIEDRREERIRSIAELGAAYLESYKLRHPDSATFAKYALGHVTRLLGKKLRSAIDDDAIVEYQNARIKEKAGAKTINEEVGFLLRLLEDQGDVLRARMHRKGTLKLKLPPSVAKAFTEVEKATMLVESKRRATLPNGSKAAYPALLVALRCGLRDKETRRLRLMDVDLIRRIITIGMQSKTEASTGRTVPMNDEVFHALKNYMSWYLSRFGETRPEWYLFPFGAPQPRDPSSHQTSFKTVWSNIKDACGIIGRWHDNRHTFITDLAEDPAVSDQTLMSMAGHVSRQMLKHYNHTRMEAKRRAVAGLISTDAAKDSAKVASSEN